MVLPKEHLCILEGIMTNKILSYNEFINESRIAIAWAKPSRSTISVLQFISEKEKVTKKELMEFLGGMEEDSSGKKPSMRWVSNQKKYIKYKVQEEDANYYHLTPLGNRVLKASILEESK